MGVDDVIISVNGASPKNNASALSDAEKTAFTTLLQPSAATRPGQGWHRVGPSDFQESDRWRSAARAAAAASEAMQRWEERAMWVTAPPKDNSAMLQALIDASANHTTIVPPGVYHIGTPLKVGGRSFLMGSGPDKTIIFALDPSMSMVVGNGEGGSYRFSISGVTLAGASYGVHMTEATFGLHAQVTESQVSHVLFANMSVAGIKVEDIYGVDNNLFSHLTFDNCSVGFWQHAPASQREPGSDTCKQAFDNKNMNYMDKVVFYRNRYIGSGGSGGGGGSSSSGNHGGVGVLLSPCRGDNLNMWFECSFEGLDDAMVLTGNSDAFVVHDFRFVANGVRGCELCCNFSELPAFFLLWYELSYQTPARAVS
jgi:hypothetical protein